ncbi:type II secretion system F family protein [Paenibacillus sp. GCM10023252]|uniref:type II secretion system F family protein n=1 Tax=Paenibacillus sp. GCM10023252 TaxID=3252649 RepID=UPI003618142D
MGVAMVIGVTMGWMVLLGREAMSRLFRVRRAEELNQLLVVDPFLRLMEKEQLDDYIQTFVGNHHVKLAILHGAGWTIASTKREIASAAGNGLAAMYACAWLGLLAEEPVLVLFGGVIGVLLVLRPFLEGARQVERRRQDIVLELPEMLSKLMLLVGAGETVQGALARCMEGKEAPEGAAVRGTGGMGAAGMVAAGGGVAGMGMGAAGGKATGRGKLHVSAKAAAVHPLYQELGAVVQALRNGESLDWAMERFNRRCAVQEASIFTTVLLLNYRRGGEHFVLALRQLSYTLWEKRKATARKRGEEASSKLVFPLVGLLLVMMLLVAAPAMLLMS